MHYENFHSMYYFHSESTEQESGENEGERDEGWMNMTRY